MQHGPDLLNWGNILMSVFRDEGPPLASLDTVLAGRSAANSTITSDELYAMALAKVAAPAKLGRVGFNPGLVDAMPLVYRSQLFARAFLLLFHVCPRLAVGHPRFNKPCLPGCHGDWIGQLLPKVVLDGKQLSTWSCSWIGLLPNGEALTRDLWTP